MRSTFRPRPRRHRVTAWAVTISIAALLAMIAPPVLAVPGQDSGGDFGVCETDLWQKWEATGDHWESSPSWPDDPPAPPSVSVTTEGDGGPWAVHWESSTPVAAVGVKASTDVSMWPGGTSGDVTGWTELKDDEQTIDHAISFIVFCYEPAEQPSYELRILKIDDDQEPLSGAAFAIGADDDDDGLLGEGEVDDTCTTGDSGTCSFTFDEPFVGLVDELLPPDGYVGDALVQVDAEDYVDGVALVTVVNLPEETPPPEPDPATVTVTKVLVDDGERWDGTDFGFALEVGESQVTFALGAGETSDTMSVDAGTSMALTETASRGADGVTMTLAVGNAAPTDYVDGTPLIAAEGASYAFVVTNTFDPVEPLPASIGLTKVATPDVVVFTDGQPESVTVTYLYTVTNLGEADLLDVTVFDETLDRAVTLTATELAPGASATGTLELVVTPADTGAIENTAVARAVTGDGREVEDEAEETVDVVAVEPTVIEAAEIDVLKSANVATVVYDPSDADEEVVTYTYTVTNPGVATLYDVTLVDDVLGAITLPTTTLAEGDMLSVTATYTVGEDDVGTILRNTVTVVGHTLDGRTVTAKDSAEVPVTQVKGIVIVKPDTLPVTGAALVPLLGWAMLALVAGGLLVRKPQ